MRLIPSVTIGTTGPNASSPFLRPGMITARASAVDAPASRTPFEIFVTTALASAHSNATKYRPTSSASAKTRVSWKVIEWSPLEADAAVALDGIEQEFRI